MSQHVQGYQWVELPAMNYKGWTIDYYPHRCYNDTYRAYRAGVKVNSDNLNNLKELIDRRIKDYPWEGRYITPAYRQKVFVRGVDETGIKELFDDCYGEFICINSKPRYNRDSEWYISLGNGIISVHPSQVRIISND